MTRGEANVLLAAYRAGKSAADDLNVCQALRITGDLESEEEGRYIAEAILHRCVEDGDCLVWGGPVDCAGAPYLRSVRVRRHMWEQRTGKPVPSGKVVVPDCGRKRCVEHLVLSTKAEVMVKTLARPDVAARKKVAARSIPRLNKKLDASAVDAIRSSTKTQRELAKEHGVAQSLVSRVINRQAWSVPTPNPFAGL